MIQPTFVSRCLAACTLLVTCQLVCVPRVAGTEQVDLYFDPDVPQVTFAVADLSAALQQSGLDVIVNDLEARKEGRTNSSIWLLDQSDASTLASAGLNRPIAVRRLKSEGYALRKRVRSARVTCYVIGADAAGAMYGGLELAELIRTGVALRDVKDAECEPYMAMRGTKFNIPLDVRTPSYTDVCDSAQQNIPEMWSFDFWQEYIDTLARYRYNYVSLWSLHPFPSLVRCPDFPDVALDDVQRSTVEWNENYSLNGVGFDAPEILENVEVVKQMTMDEKIKFWRQVMRYGKERNVDFYFVTWNIFVNGTGGKYGITDNIENPVTIKYFRQSVEQMFLTYPDLAGIGLTTGENMHGADFQQKEDWAFSTYAQGVLDAVKKQPGRKVTFIHRQHQTGAQDIARKFAPLIKHPDVEFIFSFKYAKAHAMSATTQPYHEAFVNDIGQLKTIWTLRNDDNYYFRWGAPDFVREFIQNIPHEVSRGFYYGSDQYIWGREFLSRQPDSPRQIEIAKHWYHWMIWGRLGYDPTLSDDRFRMILESRFPVVPANQLFTAWQDASMIYPLTTGFHWGALDFQWYIEGCQSRPGPAENETGFHDINRFITLAPHKCAGCMGVREYLRRKRTGAAMPAATPAEVAGQIERRADNALRIVDELAPGRDKETIRTLEDIRAMSLLGKYYAHKIRAAQELGEYRETRDKSCQQRAIQQLNAAAHYWRRYASTALGQYHNPLWTNRVGYVDWRTNYGRALQDIAIAGGEPQVASMKPSKGGVILPAGEATRRNMHLVSHTDFPGDYLEADTGATDRGAEWTIEVPASGRYALEFLYTLQNDGRFPCPVAVDGEDVAELVCWTTGGAHTWVWDRVSVSLAAGNHKIRIRLPAAVLLGNVNVLPGARRSSR